MLDHGSAVSLTNNQPDKECLGMIAQAWVLNFSAFLHLSVAVHFAADSSFLTEVQLRQWPCHVRVLACPQCCRSSSVTVNMLAMAVSSETRHRQGK